MAKQNKKIIGLIGKKKETTAHAAPLLVCYTAIFSVVTQCSSPPTAAEN